MLVVPKVGQRLWLTMVLDYVRGATGGNNPLFYLHLYKNDTAPTIDSVLGDFTEANFPGYSPKPIGADFAFPTTNGDGNAESKSNVYAWTPSNANDNQEVHGWYLTFQSDSVPALLFAAERIQPAFKCNQVLVALRLRIKLTLGSRFG
jgi:hypothetical protein